MSKHTVYVNNLNEKVKVEELKLALETVFCKFGKILEVQANKALRRRGQAWVVFDVAASAERCIAEMQGFNFYEKPMRLAFAKAKSDVIAKRDGTYKPRESIISRPPKRKQSEALGGEAPRQSNGKRARAEAQVEVKPDIKSSAPLPNRVLFVEDLGSEVQTADVRGLFDAAQGFQDVRLVPGRGVAFVDFENDYVAGMALSAAQGKTIGGKPIRVSFARR